MNAHSILQRVRFAPQSKKPVGTVLFNRDAWQQKRENLYWRGPGLTGDTFFNAFPLNHWRYLTRIKSLFLRLRVEGKFLLELFAHDTLAEKHPLGTFALETGEFLHAFDSPPPRILRLSFTLTPQEESDRLLEGSWETADTAPDFRPAILISLNGPSPIVERLQDDALLQSLGVSIRVVDQQGLGSIGGLWRAIRETEATHYLTLDDDIEFDPDAVLRALRMAQFAKKPFILAGMMLDPLRPQIMAAAGFSFPRNPMGFREIVCYLRETNIASEQALNALSIPYRSQFNPWSFSIIPAEVFAKTGPPLPLYHPPDADFGARALEKGYEIHTVPGIAGWHLYERQKTRVTRFFEKYNPLVLNAAFGYEPCARQFEQAVLEAAQFLIRHRYGACITVLLAMEQFLSGWAHFRIRTFPDYAAALKQQLSLYPPDEEIPVHTPNPEIYAYLQKRLDTALAVFKKFGEGLQKEWEEKLPRAASAEAWEGFLSSGNLTTLPE